MEIFSTTLIISAMILSAMAFYGLSKRHVPGAVYFAMLLAAMAIHSVGYAFELLSLNLDNMYLYIRIEYIGIAFLPTLIFLFSSRATDEKKIANKYVIFFIIIVNLMTIIFVNTNEYHNLYYKSVGIYEVSGHKLLKLEKGPWYYIHSIMMILSNLYGIFVFIRKAFTSNNEYRKRAFIMLFGTSIPLSTYLIYIFGFGPSGIDLLPFSYLIMSILMGIGFFKYDILFLTPVTHENIFNSIDEGVLVLDENYKIISFNFKIKEFFKSIENLKMGDSVERVMELKKFDFSNEISNYEIQNKIYELKVISVKKIMIKMLVVKDITEAEKIKKKLEYLATTDVLTGIYNRGYFMNMFNNNYVEGVFAIIDIDHFKNINDKYGHSEGDRVLSYFGEEMKNYFKEEMICRYGGEEFAIYFEKVSLENAYEKIENFRKYIIKRNYEKNIFFTFSSGLSICKNDGKGESIIMADKKLYEAKESGRNNVKY